MLLVFNRLPELPEEIKFRILSHLALNYFYGFNKKFCKKLVEEGCKDFLFAHLKKRVKNVGQISLYRNRINGAPMDLWRSIGVFGELQSDPYYIQVKVLLDGSKLRNDMMEFKSLFPHNIEQISKDNLVLKMYANARKLLLEK